MENPLIVFVEPGRVDKRADEFPFGWKKGEALGSAVLPSENYSILLLDDTRPVPNIGFANKDSAKPLLIITHIRSTENSISQIQENTLLKSWGVPYVCQSFHHWDENETYLRIQDLLSGNISETKFVQEHQNAHHLELYDRLAALCQLKLIDSEIKADELAGPILGHLPMDFQNRFRERHWPERLNLIRDRAAIIAK